MARRLIEGALLQTCAGLANIERAVMSIEKNVDGTSSGIIKPTTFVPIGRRLGSGGGAEPIARVGAGLGGEQVISRSVISRVSGREERTPITG